MASSVKGWDKLQKKFQALDRGLQVKLLETAVTAGALVIENDAKEKVRVKTGTAKRSISHWILEQSNEKLLMAIGTPKMSSDGISLSYTWYLEFRYPFLRPAFDTKRKEAVSEVKDAIAEQIQKIAR